MDRKLDAPLAIAHETTTSLTCHLNVFDIEPESVIPSSALRPSSSLLPPELWLSIFSYLKDKDLETIALTCSVFRLLAQPLLFQVLDVCPFFLAYNTDRPIYRPRRYLQWTLERLEFYKSPHIAPRVTRLWVSPYSRKGFPPRRLTDDLNPTLVISAIIDALPFLPNIRTLAWHCIDIQPSWWIAIQQLPLTRLWLNSSTVLPSPRISSSPFPSRSPALRVMHLDLDQWAWEGHVTNHVSIHEERLSGVDPFLLSSTIHCNGIKTVSVPRHDTALHLLSVLSHLEKDTLCTLVSITIPYSSTNSEDFIPALIQSAPLRELHILSPSGDNNRCHELRAKLPCTSIPLLELYEGPYFLLQIFANGQPGRKSRRLRYIDLWGLDEQVSAAVCDPRKLVPVLEGAVCREESLEALETVHLSLTHITIELFNLLGRFSHLKEITIESQDSLVSTRSPAPHVAMELLPESPVTVLFIILRSHKVSASLKRLTLVTHLKNSSNLDSGTQKLEAAKFLEGLGQANPHLERIDLRYGTYWTGIVDIEWRRKLSLAENNHSEERESDVNGSSEHHSFESGGAPLIPPFPRSSTASPVASDAPDSSHVAVEKFFALPSRPRITTNIELTFGRMTFTEQKRAIVLSESSLTLEEAKAGTSGPRWLAGGMSRIRHIVGRVRKVIGDGMGLVRG